MNWIEIAAFVGPIALVLVLFAFNSVFNGRKTDLLGTAVAILGGLQTFNWSFIPAETSSALLTGSGIAVLLVSRMTERA